MAKTRHHLRIVLSIASLAVAAAVVFGARATVPGDPARYVALDGSDGNPGTLERPWRTVQTAVSRLRPGDTLYVREGTYLEHVVVAVHGTAERPIVVRSHPGERVVLDSGEPDFRAPGNEDWELVDATLGEWRARRAFTPERHVYAQVLGIPGYRNGRVALVPYTSAAAFRAASEEYVDQKTPFYVGPGTFWDPSDRRLHVRFAKTADLRAAERRYGTVFADERPDPRRYAIVLSHAATTLAVTGSHLVFRDLTVNQAQNSVHVRADAHHVTFEGVTVWVGDSGIELDGVHAVRVLGSRIYGDVPDWIFWSDLKDPPAPADLMRTTSIDLRSGTHDVEIARSHLRGSGQDLIGTAHDERDVRVHHCRLENALDDAFELEGHTDVGRIEIHDNYVLNCLTAVAPGQDTRSFSGPLLVYRNVVASLRRPPINRREGINGWNGGGRFGHEYMFKHGQSGSYTTRNAHYYHNTLVLLGSNGKGLNLVPKDPTDARIANNLLVVVNGVVNRDYRPARGLVIDGNLYWKVNGRDGTPLLAQSPTVAAWRAASGFEVHGVGGAPGQGTDPRFAGWEPRFIDRTAAAWELAAESETPPLTAFFLREDSPAAAAGIAIPPHPALGPLPDTQRSRDLGAIPLGVSPSDYEGFPFEPGAYTDSLPPIRS